MQESGQITSIEKPLQIQQVCNDFLPISLAEMDSVKLLDRFDKKFVLNAQMLPGILQHAFEHYRILTIRRKRIFEYRTQYYDTPTFGLYLDHHNRKLNRLKVRKREYVTTRQVFFELKFKTNKGRTRKKRIEIDSSKSTLYKTERKFLKKNTHLVHRDLEPKVLNQFSRITLVSKLSTERVTIDFDLKYQLNGSSIDLPFLSIIEIKQGRSSGISELEWILRVHKVAPFKISKYCIGSLLLDKSLKYNRFKNKLFTLNNLSNDNSYASVFIRS